MNILILNWRDIKNPKSGGAEIVTMGHAKAWVGAGHKVTWFTSSYKNALRHEDIEGVNIVRSGNFITVYFLAPFYYLKNKNKIDLVIDEIHGLPFFTPLYVKKSRIAFIHEVAEEIWDYMYPFPINMIGRGIESFFFKFYKNTQFWVPCESTIKDLERYGIKRSSCKKVICAIKNKALDKLPSDKEKLRTFIFVSRVVRMKGIEEVIDAFSNILEVLPDAKLWIVGDGDEGYVNSLRKIIKDKSIDKSVKFFGRVSEEKKLELMRRAHLLLHASVKEGWGLVTVEAASQGTPSVVYNVSGLRDSVLNNLTGIVIDKNSPKKMADESISLIKDEKRYLRLQKGGLKWARSLSWDIAIKESLSLINEVYKKNNK